MGNTYSHPSLPAPAAWSDSQLDICLDQLGTAEGVVRDQEVELAVLRAALMALSSPWVVVGLAAGFSLLAVFEVVRLIWYLCTGHVENSFPLDRFCGWFLRRVWRVLRFPFVVLAEQMFGRRAAEGVRNQIDQLAVSPVQQQEQPPPYSVREDHRRAVPVFQPYQPRPAVVGRDLEDVESAASSISIPPPPPPLSASTIYHSAREAPPTSGPQQPASICCADSWSRIPWGRAWTDRLPGHWWRRRPLLSRLQRRPPSCHLLRLLTSPAGPRGLM